MCHRPVGLALLGGCSDAPVKGLHEYELFLHSEFARQVSAEACGSRCAVMVFPERVRGCVRRK